jgi:hypothetical protein
MDMPLSYKPELRKGATGLASSAATPIKTPQTKGLLLTLSPWLSSAAPKTSLFYYSREKD